MSINSQNWLPFASTCVHTRFLVGSVLLIYLVISVVVGFFCVVFLCFLSSSCILCTQCCQCLWIFHSLFALRFSLTFIYRMKEYKNNNMNSILFRLYLQTWINGITYRSVIDMLVDLSILIFAKNNNGLYNFAKALTLIRRHRCQIN